MKGIDISHYQGSIDFTKVKAAGIQVVIIKATEGMTYKDPNFKQYYDGAKAAGLLVGAYHFLRGNSVTDELNNFLSVISGLDFNCKLVIDSETDLGGINVTSQRVKAFYDLLKLKGKEAVLYTGECFYNSYFNETVKDIPLWVAKYSTSKPSISSYIGWQYTSSGSVDGIAGNVDMSDFTDDILINKSVKEIKVKDLVVCGNSVDRRAAEYLADYLQCPTMHSDIPFDYSVIENVYCVGSPGNLPFTSYAKKIITGTDRYDTVIQVLKFMGRV